MKIKQYDRVLLKDGSKASIVEIFVEDSFFLADIDRNGDTDTEEIRIEQIEKVLLENDLTVEEKVVKLIKKCNARGGNDNISVAYLVRESGEIA